MANSPYVLDVTEADFQQLVVEKSKEVPVLVDFWAPWCAPCRALSPLLEELADEYSGQFILAKVNVDDNPQLAGAFNVSGIPSVFAIKDQKVLDHFSGLMDEDQLRNFLAGLNPSPEQLELAAAMQLATQDQAAGLAALHGLYEKNPGNELTRLSLASLLIEMNESPEEAGKLLAPIESGELADEASRLKRVLALMTTPHTDADLEAVSAAAHVDENDVELRMTLAATLAARGEYAEALEHYYQAAELDKEKAGGEIREAMVNLFHIIGVRSELADEYRDKLRALLY